MTTAVKLFKSTDTGAPTLSGTAGDLIALLDACLINGYNLKSVTSITRSGTTATVTVPTGHGLIDYDVVLIAGANESAYNGEFHITNVTTTTFDVTVSGSPATPATGTITCKKAPAGNGWTKAFSGTNKAAYKSTASGATGFHLRVDDTTTTYAAMLGYESMTDIDTGLDAFGSGRSWWKSSSADATARAWVLVADDRFVQLWTGYSASAPSVYALHTFGDVVSELTADPYACLLSGHNSTSQPSVNTHVGDVLSTDWNSVAQGNVNYVGYLARSANGISKNITAFALAGLGGLGAGTLHKPGEANNSPARNLPYPSPVNGGVYAFQCALGDNGGQIGFRGYWPGFFATPHYQPIANLGTYNSVSSQTAGRKFLALNTGSWLGNVSGQAHVDVTGPWR